MAQAALHVRLPIHLPVKGATVLHLAPKVAYTERDCNRHAHTDDSHAALGPAVEIPTNAADPAALKPQSAATCALQRPTLGPWPSKMHTGVCRGPKFGLYGHFKSVAVYPKGDGKENRVCVQISTSLQKSPSSTSTRRSTVHHYTQVQPIPNSQKLLNQDNDRPFEPCYKQTYRSPKRNCQ